MFYYYIDNGVSISDIELNEGNGYADDRAKPISQEQYQFGIANKGASYEEVIAMQMTPLTDEQLLEQARATKLAQIQAEEDAIRDAGWEDSQTGLRLFLRDEDTIRYTQFKVKHMSKADDVVLQLGTYQGWQPLTKAVAFEMLDRYGDYAEGLYQQYSTRYAMLKYATTIEQINLI